MGLRRRKRLFPSGDIMEASYCSSYNSVCGTGDGQYIIIEWKCHMVWDLRINARPRHKAIEKLTI